MVMNRSLQVCIAQLIEVVMLIAAQEVNIQNMNVELVAQMFKNYQSNVLFHLEGLWYASLAGLYRLICLNSHRDSSRTNVIRDAMVVVYSG